MHFFPHKNRIESSGTGEVQIFGVFCLGLHCICRKSREIQWGKPVYFPLVKEMDYIELRYPSKVTCVCVSYRIISLYTAGSEV